MGYYLREIPGQGYQAWKIEGDTAVLLGITNPENGPGTYYKAEPGQDIWDVLKQSTPWFSNGNPFIETDLRHGQYYPRMARPIDHHPLDNPGWSPGQKDAINFIAEAKNQLIVLTHQLNRVARTVHPEPSTMNAYGHDIRNLLILACTEVEHHWRGVLETNGLIKQRYSTTDYVKIVPALRLRDYSVSFKSFPWLSPVTPFANWGTTQATTRDLPWYDSYNAVKHNREAHFSDARLEHAFSAVSACAIMMVAQFGLHDFRKTTDLNDVFGFSDLPTWPIKDVYVFPYGEQPYGQHTNWTPVNYPFLP